MPRQKTLPAVTTLSPRALNVLQQLFAEGSNLNLPVGVAAEVMEIRAFATPRPLVAPEEPETA